MTTTRDVQIRVRVTGNAPAELRKIEEALQDEPRGFDPFAGWNARIGALDARLAKSFGNVPGLSRLSSVASIASLGLSAAAAAASVAMEAITTAASLMADGLVASVHEATELDAAMSRVRAATGGARTDMGRLVGQAAELARHTRYSALDVARMQESAARMGLRVEDVVPAAADLAAVTGAEPGDATAQLGGLIRDTGLGSGSAGALADVLATSSQVSGVDTATVAEGIAAVGASLRSMDPSDRLTGLEEVSTLATLLGEAGTKTDDTTSALRAIFENRGDPQGRMRGTLESLGVSPELADVSSASVPQMLTTFRDALEGRSEAERKDAIDAAFGSEGTSAIRALLEADPARFAEVASAFRDTEGAAGRAARMMRDDLAGDLEELRGTFSELGAAVGSHLLPDLRSSVTAVADFTGALASVLGASDAGATGFGKLGGAIEWMTEAILSMLQAVVPRIAGVLETFGILEDGQAADFATKLADALTETRLERVETNSQHARDQIETNYRSRNDALNSLSGRVRGAQGASGFTLAADVTSRFREAGLESMLEDGETARLLRELEGRGAMSERQRRSALGEIDASLAPRIEAERRQNAERRTADQDTVSDAEREARNRIQGGAEANRQAALGNAAMGRTLPFLAAAAPLAPGMVLPGLAAGEAVVPRSAGADQARALAEQTRILTTIANNTGRTPRPVTNPGVTDPNDN